jgi:hypothetical protein
MPTVLRSGPYRVFFYSGDRNEPPHVHVERESAIAKFWLDPVRTAYARSFSQVELRHIGAMIRDNEIRLIEAWHEFFGT